MPAPIPPPRESGFTSMIAVPLYWARYGRPGAPGLVILHGGPGAHHDYLLPQMLALADRYELLFYDQRGGGRSRVTDATPVTWHTHVEDLGGVIAELAPGPLTLVGYSWGGLLALLYALEAPRLTSPPPARLVLIDPAPVTRALRTRFEQDLSSRQNAALLQRQRAELAQSGLRESDPDAYRQRLFELGVAGYFADPARAHDLTPFRVTGRVQQSVWESLGDFDLTPRLTEIPAPTLITHGRHDPVPLASSEAIAAAMPDARLVILEGSGHVPYVEAPEPLFDAITRFLDETALQAAH